MITRLSAIPKNKIINCDFVIITHYLPNTNYVFENEKVFKKVGNKLKPISTYMSGRCKVIKINGKPLSVSKLNQLKKKCIMVFVTNIFEMPF
jgi:hypothetical protein